MQLTDKRAWLFVGYYTPDKNYFSLAKRMQESVQKQGFECQIFERPSALCLRRPPMPWVLNCAQCAEFCLEQFEANPERSIFYLDADAEMLRQPELLLSPFLPEFDVGVNMGHGKQVNSGTLIFRRTENAKKVLLAWVEEQKFQTQKMLQGAYSKPYREAWDQQTLQNVLERLKVEVLDLPWQYCSILPKDAETIPSGTVIIQYQASREHRYKLSGRKK